MKLRTIAFNVLFYGMVTLALLGVAFYLWAQRFVGATVDGIGSAK